jgi:uncharacterized membrane protein YbhN (UPF0104 family)
MDVQTWTILSTLILAALLFYPVTKVIWALSCRRLHRRLDRELTKDELKGQLQRARIVAMVLVLLFSYLFNSRLMESLYG